MDGNPFTNYITGKSTVQVSSRTTWTYIIVLAITLAILSITTGVFLYNKNFTSKAVSGSFYSFDDHDMVGKVEPTPEGVKIGTGSYMEFKTLHCSVTLLDKDYAVTSSECVRVRDKINTKPNGRSNRIFLGAVVKEDPRLSISFIRLKDHMIVHGVPLSMDSMEYGHGVSWYGAGTRGNNGHIGEQVNDHTVTLYGYATPTDRGGTVFGPDGSGVGVITTVHGGHSSYTPMKDVVESWNRYKRSQYA